MGNCVLRTSALCASLVLSMARFSSCAVLPFLRGLPLINNAFIFLWFGVIAALAYSHI